MQTPGFSYRNWILQLTVVEFDDLRLIDISRKFGTLRITDVLSFDLVEVDSDESEDGRLLGDVLGDDLQGLRSILEGDDIIDAADVGRDVDLLAVDNDMSVADELTGLTAGSSKAHTVDKVVETGFEKLKKLETGSDVLVGLSNREETTELTLGDSVRETKLLLFGHLETVFSLLLLTGLAMLSRNRLTTLKFLTIAKDRIA